MSSASRQFYRAFARLAQYPPSTKRQCLIVQHQRQVQPSCLRPLTTSTRRLAAPQSDGSHLLAKDTTDDDGPSDFAMEELQTPNETLTPADLDPEARADYDAMQPAEQQKYMAVQNHMKALFEQETMTPELQRQMDGMVDSVGYELDREMGPVQFRPDWTPREIREGFWADGEDDEVGIVPDYDDDFDDSMITSVAESELELHREMREYQRIAAWELPLLSKFVKPFQLPDVTQTPLRFRYTTYLGEDHPAGKKVVCEFTTTDLAAAAPLTPPQRVKLQKLLGVRYNPDTDLARLSSEKFSEPAQNKRYLGDLINTLIAEAKNAKDTFDDVPIDIRHLESQKRKKRKSIMRPAFPEHWNVSAAEGEAAKKIAEQREILRLADVPDKETGRKREVIDGRKVVFDYVRAKEAVAVNIGAGR